MRTTWTLTRKCFYCSNWINPKGHYMEASIRHLYANGTERDSDRRFHLPCFDKFVAEGGRPWNPRTEYEVLESEEVDGAYVEAMEEAEEAAAKEGQR